MSSNSITVPSKRPSVSKQIAMLRALGTIALDAVVADLNGFASRLEQALRARAAHGVADAEDLQRAATHLASQRVGFLRAAQSSLREAVQEEIDALTAPSDAALAQHAMDLSLDTFEAMERKVLLDNLSQAIDVRHAGALEKFNQSLALLLQREGLTPAQNPFRPEVFVRAMAQAWDRFEHAAAPAKVLEQFRPAVFLQLGPMLEALQREIVVQLATSRLRRQVAAAGQAPSPEEQLQRWLDAATEQQIGMFVTETFTRLREAVPAGHFSLLLRLQPAVLYIVRSDRKALADSAHSVRRLLDTLVRHGSQADPNGTLAQMMSRIVHHIEREAAADAGLFAHLRTTLEESISRWQAHVSVALRDTIAQATHAERHDELRALALADVTARLQTGEVAGFVELFLQTQWVRVLAIAHGMREAKPDKLAGLLQAMDDLIWSVKPKASPEERRELVSRLPALLALLNAWLNVVKWQGEDRENFFATLAKRHAAVVRTPLESMPRQQLEIAMNIAQKASEHRFGRQTQDELTADVGRTRMDNMQLGDRLQFGKRVKGVKARLAWISPGRRRFILVRDDGGKPLVFTARELNEALQRGTASMSVDGALTQALAQAWSKLQAN